jgi:phage baseplate assembly protein W
MLKGFTTKRFKMQKTFRIFDIDVICNDLLNYIKTIKGERPHMPNFGTRIPLLAFKPIDSMTISIIEQDLKEAITYDGRVSMLDFAVLNEQNGLKVIVDLKVNYTGQTFKLDFSF